MTGTKAHYANCRFPSRPRRAAWRSAKILLRRASAGKRSHLFSQVARYLPQQQVLDIQETLGFAGHSVIIANACASGANAIGHAADLISVGEAECVLAGGFEAITELVFVGFDCLQATTTDRCRPFDLNRTGLMIGEAAAFLVLESAEHAERRGAAPLCELTGYGHTTDFFHLDAAEAGRRGPGRSDARRGGHGQNHARGNRLHQRARHGHAGQ